MQSVNALVGVLCFLFVGVSLATAARVPEDRKSASHVVSGKVVEVVKGGSRQITVRVKVAEVHRGAGIEVGETVDLMIYGPPNIRRVDPENEAFKKLPEEKQKELMLQMLVDQITFAGHKAPPEVGAQARIYFGKRDGKRWEGTYPDWYDLIGKTKPEASKLRQQESGGSKAKAAIQKEQTEEPASE